MNILFVNHSAQRTGAPIVLLHFLKWLKYTKKVNFDVLSLSSGDLIDDFTEVSKHHYYGAERNLMYDKIIRIIKSQIKKEKIDFVKYPLKELDTIAKNKYDVIYANTIVSIPIAHYIKNKSTAHTKLIVHFHELNLTIHRQCPQLLNYRDIIDLNIAASNKVKENLILNWGFDASRLKVIYEYSKIPEVVVKTSDSFIVGASGQVDWRKGPDFFILVADYVHKKLPKENIYFQWVGKISRMNRLVYEEDLRKLNLEKLVQFTGVTEKPHDYFSNFDVFLMTSKEDPFPLVCIEIGMMGIPIVCFEGATGTEEVLQDIEESIVPYLDVAKMGDRVIRYYEDEQLKISNGIKTKKVFQEFTPENQSIKIYEAIKSLNDTSID